MTSVVAVTEVIDLAPVTTLQTQGNQTLTQILTALGGGVMVTPANGQINIGNGTNFTLATITPGVGVSVTNGAGSITLDLSNTGVTTGTFGSASVIPVITINAQGQITGVTTQTPVLTATQINNALLSTNVTVNGVVVGRGTGNIASNTAVGNTALNANTTGVSNTAVGNLSAGVNTTGSYNAAFGYGTLSKNLTGSSNTAVGNVALFNNTSGALNSAIGGGALANNTAGNSNVAMGLEALNTNTTGSFNIAIGGGAQFTGNASNNVAVGTDANRLGTGGNNTAIGYQAMYPSNSCVNVFALGYLSGNDALRTVTTDTNIGIIGNNSITAIYTKVALTVVSDERDKNVITRDLPIGLDYINQVANTALITYTFKASREDDTPSGRVRYGLSAQKALAAGDSVVIDATDPNKLRYHESDMVAVLIKAVAELSEKVAKLEAKK